LRELAALASSYYYVPYGVALLGAAISVYTDIRWHKIKNYVTFPMILFGWLWPFCVGGLRAGIANVLLSCFLGFLSSLSGKLGNGDIKLNVGIAACLQWPLSFMFLAFFFVIRALSAVYVRLRVYGFKLKPAILAMKTEASMELSGIEDANVTIHGEKVEHLGGPLIFLALILCLVKARIGGII